MNHPLILVRKINEFIIIIIITIIIVIMNTKVSAGVLSRSVIQYISLLPFVVKTKWVNYNNNDDYNNNNNNNLRDLEIQEDHLISVRQPDMVIVHKKKRETLPNRGLSHSDWPLEKAESEKRNNYLDLARELKKLWNMKVMMISIVIGMLGTVTKGLLQRLEELEIRGQVENIQTTALLRSVRIRRRVLETWWDLLSLRLSEKLSANAGGKNSNNNNNNNNNRTCKIVYFAVPADHRIKLKECEKRDKYPDLAKELKKTM